MLKRLAKAGLLFILSLYLYWASGVNVGDEAWFLQVLNRLHRGDRLYRDIFFGVGPLSVYFTYPLVWVFGTEVIVVKVVSALSYVAVLAFGLSVLASLAVRPVNRLLYIVLCFILAPPVPAAPYQIVASAFFMGSFAASVRIWERPYLGRFSVDTIAGLCAGLAFLSKQNIGGYAIAAVVLATTLAPGGGPRASLKPVIAFVLASVGGLIPTLMNDSWAKFFEYGFVNKKTFLQLAGISYLDGLLVLGEAARQAIVEISLKKAAQAVRYSNFAVPVLVGIGWLGLFYFGSRHSRRLLVAVGAFMTAAFVGVFPRADYIHLTYMLLAVLIGLVVLAEEVLGRWTKNWPLGASRVLGVLESVMLLGVLLANLAAPLVRLAGGDVVRTSLPHFRGAVIDAGLENQARTGALHLARLRSEGPLFLVTPLAGFWYLVGGIENPTPYDFPLATAFGLDGEAQVVAALESGRIRVVCWQKLEWPLRPARLESYIETNMEPGEDLTFCKVYRTKRPD